MFTLVSHKRSAVCVSFYAFLSFLSLIRRIHYHWFFLCRSLLSELNLIIHSLSILLYFLLFLFCICAPVGSLMGLTITLECLHPLSPSNYCITVQSSNGNAGNERQKLKSVRRYLCLSLIVSAPELFFLLAPQPIQPISEANKAGFHLIQVTLRLALGFLHYKRGSLLTQESNLLQNTLNSQITDGQVWNHHLLSSQFSNGRLPVEVFSSWKSWKK